jgi:flavin-dependent dehydrogenase
VVVLDRETFPRVKLCAGWLSEPIWDELELAPTSYPHGLWTWERCHVFYKGRSTSAVVRGHFIRRVEFDAFLLRHSRAEVAQHAVKSIVRDGDQWVVDERYRARYLVGAGGTHCPVARLLAPTRTERAVGVQELEFEAGTAAVAASRMGADGEPELLLHDDFGGYSWNVPKTGWLNVGCGTMNARQVRDAWTHAREHFVHSGHLPAGASERLDHAKGHSYYLFDPAHLTGCTRDNAFLVGDSLGLAQPLTAEGILPAVISGRLAAEAILANDPARYRTTLARHPVLADYDLFYRLRMAGSRLKDRVAGRSGWSVPAPQLLTALGNAAVARGFAWMFAGRPVPGRRALHRLLQRSEGPS